MVCKAREGITAIDTPRHAGQFVPPFYVTMGEHYVNKELLMYYDGHGGSER